MSRRRHRHPQAPSDTPAPLASPRGVREVGGLTCRDHPHLSHCQYLRTSRTRTTGTLGASGTIGTIGTFGTTGTIGTRGTADTAGTGTASTSGAEALRLRSFLGCGAFLECKVALAARRGCPGCGIASAVRAPALQGRLSRELSWLRVHLLTSACRAGGRARPSSRLGRRPATTWTAQRRERQLATTSGTSHSALFAQVVMHAETVCLPRQHAGTRTADPPSRAAQGKNMVTAIAALRRRSSEGH